MKHVLDSSSLDRNGFRGFQDTQAHRVARRVVQDAGQVIEAHHPMEPASQVLEERAWPEKDKPAHGQGAEGVLGGSGRDWVMRRPPRPGSEGTRRNRLDVT